MKRIIPMTMLAITLIFGGFFGGTAFSQEEAVEPIVKCEVDEIPVDQDKDGDIDFCVHCNYAKCTVDEQEVVDPWGCVRACKPIKK